MPKPSDFKFSLDIPYDEGDNDANESSNLLNNNQDNSYTTTPSCWDSVSSVANYLSCGIWAPTTDSGFSNGISRQT